MWYRSTEHSSAVLICSSYNKTAFIWKFAKGIDRVAKFCNTRSYNISIKDTMALIVITVGLLISQALYQRLRFIDYTTAA